jgi:hypothetical protein
MPPPQACPREGGECWRGDRCLEVIQCMQIHWGITAIPAPIRNELGGPLRLIANAIPQPHARLTLCRLQTS